MSRGWNLRTSVIWTPAVVADSHPGPSGRARASLDDNLHVATEQHQESDESIEREPRQPPARERRDLRLVDLEQVCGRGLRQPPPLDDGPDLPRQLGFGQRFCWPRVSQIREHVASVPPGRAVAGAGTGWPVSVGPFDTLLAMHASDPSADAFPQAARVDLGVDRVEAALIKAARTHRPT